MELEYIKITKKSKGTQFICPHNEACVCTTKSCYNCGWNPKCAEKRLNRILGKGTGNHG